jgi:hypothetical protein
MTTEMTIWNPRQTFKIPPTAQNASQISEYIRQLPAREVQQVIKAYEVGNFEMGSLFLWSKTMAGLKKQIASLGMEFIGEMLDRPDMSQSDVGIQALSDYDAVSLAEELGMFTSTESMRLRRVLEMIAHFSEPLSEEDDEEDRRMMPEEFIDCLRTCVQSVLGHERLEAPLEFARFRQALEEETFTEASLEIQSLRLSPYFFQRTALRVLLALTKTAHGAQLQHSLANANIIVPLLWRNLLKPDRWTVGRAYSEVYSEGKKTAAEGLRKLLLKVQGFDYVPEDLRSRTFIAAAIDLKKVHFDFYNFYNEPKAIHILESLGSVIPVPALAHCVSAVLCVRLGNSYNVSFAAQDSAKVMLQRLGEPSWKYYLDECLPGDATILEKLMDSTIAKRWSGIVKDNNLADIDVDNRDIRTVVEAGAADQARKVAAIATGLLRRLTGS